MSKLLVITPTATDAVKVLEQYGLKIEDAKLVRRIEDIHGFRDMLIHKRMYARKRFGVKPENYYKTRGDQLTQQNQKEDTNNG